MTKEKLIENLNKDLAGELQAIIMYLTYGASVSGPHRPGLRNFFVSEIADETRHAQFLADKVYSLGGTPTTEPRAVPPADDAKTMLENVLKAEEQAIKDYKKRAEQAKEYGDVGLSTHLENIIEDETTHYEETEKILRGWGNKAN